MSLNFKSYGEGPPVIILHGLFGMLDNWRTIATKLAEDYSVYLLDQRNHGRSPHYPSHTYQEMAADVAEWMKENHIEEAYIIGHSMGGKTAIQLTYDYPDMVDKLIVVDIAPKQYSGGHEAIISALQSVPINEVESRGEVEAHLAKTINSKGVIMFLMKNLTRKKEGGFEWKMNLDVLDEFYRDHIINAPVYSKSIKTPTLFIAGGKSNYITEADREDISKLFTEVSHEICPGAGHWVHAEKPNELIQTVKNYFNSRFAERIL